MTRTGDDLVDVTRTTAPHEIPNQRAKSETIPAARPPAIARLVCVAGIDRGRAFPIGSTPLVIGRGTSSGSGLEATDISRRHARVQIVDGETTIEDLASRNGTFVDGELVTGAVPIHVGSRVQLGESTILVLTRHDELEASMRQLQTLEAMERVVGGVAHDFNNALTIMCGGVDYAVDLLPAGDSELREVLDDIRKAGVAATTLAKRLMHFRRREEGVPDEIVLLSFVVDDAFALARHVLDRSITISKSVSSELVVRGARDELQQVLLNLVLNARDAMPRGGKLSIAAQAVELSRAEATLHQLANGGQYVELRVEDTGSGMSEAVLARAFEPFFTTKAHGKGTGLGLSIVHSIVRHHGGAIEISSEIGRGTTFTIWLPSAP